MAPVLKIYHSKHSIACEREKREENEGLFQRQLNFLNSQPITSDGRSTRRLLVSRSSLEPAAKFCLHSASAYSVHFIQVRTKPLKRRIWCNQRSVPTNPAPSLRIPIQLRKQNVKNVISHQPSTQETIKLS